MRIGKKTIHTVIIGLAMAFPLVYLAGSMVFALNGAHNAFPFSADYEVPVSSKNVVFNQAISRANSNTTVNGLSVVVSGNMVNISGTTAENGYSTILSVYVPNVVVGHKYIFNTDVVLSGEPMRDSSYQFNYQLYVRGGYSQYGLTQAVIFVPNTNWLNFDFVSYKGGITFSADYSLFLTDLTLAYGEGNEPTVEEFKSDFPNYVYPYDTGTNVTVYEYGVPDNGQYLFNQFFPKGNFVERIGQNALSESPKGFAPFGTMLSYLDDNMFHAGDSQTALMVYGMVYWSLHVVLADLVYHVLVFVPNLINRVFDWFGQKGVSDE